MIRYSKDAEDGLKRASAKSMQQEKDEATQYSEKVVNRVLWATLSFAILGIVSILFLIVSSSIFLIKLALS